MKTIMYKSVQQCIISPVSLTPKYKIKGTKATTTQIRRSTAQILDKGIPANRTGTNIHPNNGVVKRTTGGFAPQQSCLSLIGQPNSLQPAVHVVAIRCGLVHCLSNAHPHTLQNLHWIMLHPSAKYPERDKLSKSN